MGITRLHISAARRMVVDPIYAAPEKSLGDRDCCLSPDDPILIGFMICMLLEGYLGW